MKTTIGGDRLGSGNKQEISMRNYERSTHDLSYLWRSSMASGTLVPFLNKLALPGDSFEIDLNAEVMTLPTIGPLFGSYKVQLDVFEIPMRLYNAKLHMNKLGIGMDMSSIFLPQLELLANNHANYGQTYEDNEHVEPSSLIKYLGISGLGKILGATNPAKRYFNAVPLLCYWSIYKNYYANKQEEIGYFIHTDDDTLEELQIPVKALVYSSLNMYKGDAVQAGVTLAEADVIYIQFPTGVREPDPDVYEVLLDAALTTINSIGSNAWNHITNELVVQVDPTYDAYVLEVPADPAYSSVPPDINISLKEFPLTNIDDMLEDILQYTGASYYPITGGSILPYSCFMKSVGTNDLLKYSCQFSQEGLGIKTYQSDLFNNWISTEWIDGDNGINEITAVSTAGDSFTIDALNLAQKVYVMLNRIAISGGTYDDWLDAVYTHERVKGVESPIYHGSLIKELAFEEVISNANAIKDNGDELPLGTLAGRGRLTGKNKGGRMNIKVNEPSYIMGIASLTPRIDYSQGNEWDTNLKTYDDFHKPALDAIGFQDLISEQLLWTDTDLDSTTSGIYQRSLGKQPAWINYMSSVNKVFGNFARSEKEMFMTLNRRYETTGTGALKDPTTYIDPTKFNQIFAESNLDSQNFWVQISVDMIARRKMSAKVIPNL